MNKQERNRRERHKLNLAFYKLMDAGMDADAAVKCISTRSRLPVRSVSQKISYAQSENRRK